MPVTDEDDFEGPISMAATQSSVSKAEQRKSNKPIMEKRRRARINHCLNELKTLILNAMKKDPARHSKLEKADILELTVKHLQNVQRQQLASAVSTDPTVITRFRNGFDECAAEVSRYISRLEGVDTGVKQRLSAHLHRCVNSLQQMAPNNQPGHHDDNNNSSSQRTVLIPSRLPTGELALVLPNYNSFFPPPPQTSAFTAIKPTDNSRFQPFQVEIPNSHLKAHITIPDRRSPNVTSPPVPLPEQKPQVSSTDDFERLRPFQRPEEKTFHQKPNPNLVLNPKQSNSPKFIRYGDVARLRHMDNFEPPLKTARFSPPGESRVSVIVTEPSRENALPVRPPEQETQRDMWRPW